MRAVSARWIRVPSGGHSQKPPNWLAGLARNPQIKRALQQGARELGRSWGNSALPRRSQGFGRETQNPAIIDPRRTYIYIYV